jgi:hypothetical protein
MSVAVCDHADARFDAPHVTKNAVKWETYARHAPQRALHCTICAASAAASTMKMTCAQLVMLSGMHGACYTCYTSF